MRAHRLSQEVHLTEEKQSQRSGSIAQLVRALALQARGQQFESACSHKLST
jgi:hypothetical protein